jgi:hypothetical protein
MFFSWNENKKLFVKFKIKIVLNFLVKGKETFDDIFYL